MAALALLSALASCAAYRAVAPSDPRLGASTTTVRLLRVAGYTTADGSYHVFAGQLRVEGDTMVFERQVGMNTGITADPRKTVVSLPREQVLSVSVEQGADLAKTVLLVLGLTGLAALVLAAAAMASFANSGPIVI